MVMVGRREVFMRHLIQLTVKKLEFQSFVGTICPEIQLIDSLYFFYRSDRILISALMLLKWKEVDAFKLSEIVRWWTILAVTMKRSDHSHLALWREKNKSSRGRAHKLYHIIQPRFNLKASDHGESKLCAAVIAN